MCAHADDSPFPVALGGVEHDANCGRVSWTAALTVEGSERLVGLVQTVSAPMLPPARPPGMEGTWYHLSLVHGSGGFDLRWWVGVPEGREGNGSFRPTCGRWRSVVSQGVEEIPPRPWWMLWG